MRTSAFFSLLLMASACNGALPSAAETTASSGSGAAAGSGTGGEASTTGAAASGSTGGSVTGSATASGASSSAGATTGESTTGAASGGGTSGGGGTSAGIGTASGAGSSTGGSGTGGGTSTGGSACNPACAARLTCCGSTCVDLTADTFNCGQCGKQCAESDYCSGSKCVAALCPGGGCTSNSCCGGRCCDANAVCCLDNGLVETFVCEDPDAGACPVGCAPMCVSRRAAKRDIQYLDDAQLRSAEEQVMKIPLARFNYKWDAPGERRRLGFIIEDVAPNPGIIDEARGEVDLYGYASLAVAAVQEQAKEIARLRRQVDELQKQLGDRKVPRRPKR